MPVNVLTQQPIHRQLPTKIRQALLDVGFYAASWVSLAPVESTFQEFYINFLKSGKAGILKYLYSVLPKFFPQKILPQARSALLLLAPYLTPEAKALARQARFRIAAYALGKDYHKVLKKKVRRALQPVYNDAFRVVTDSTPFPERYFARLSGLGFIGRNGMLIHPQGGSYFFLVAILFPFQIQKQAAQNKGLPQQDFETFCKNCFRCVEACPTGALLGDGTLHSNLCLSTITIEDKGSRLKMPSGKKHRWVFGCDVCQQVCPYNRQPIYSMFREFEPTRAAYQISRGESAALQETDLQGTAFQRAGLKKIKHTISILSS